MKTKIKPDERVQHVVVNQDMLHLLLRDGRHLIVPLNWFPRLEGATVDQRKNWEILGGGFVIRWPDIDEDIEISGLLAGNAAPERRESVSIEGAQIREYRRRAKLSQSELAEKLGVRQATVSDWEKQKTDPSPLALSRLTDAIRRLQLSTDISMELMSYPSTAPDMSFGPDTSIRYLDAGARKFLARCLYVENGTRGATILPEECEFSDLQTMQSLGIFGPTAPTRFNPVHRLVHSCALSPK